MSSYRVRFVDGSEEVIEARDMSYGEHGLSFEGHRDSPDRYTVAFVPYRALICVWPQR